MNKIMLYCQHVLGIGHFFRSLEICKALEGHDVILISGGPQIDTPLPSHVREFKLPGLMMDKEFKGLLPADEDESIDDIKKDRKKLLLDMFERESPDIFIIELYPFGRKSFRFELDPVLHGILKGKLGPSHVICSLRDILVEKKDPSAYEERVIGVLNRYFDALLVHADPSLIALEETFSGVDRISIPIVYTGFVTPRPETHAGSDLRHRLGIGKNDLLIVASAGGGKVGYRLLEAAIQAIRFLEWGNTIHTYIFTGPYMNSLEFEGLESLSGVNTKVTRFTNDFLSYLAATDLSISMAGYNTCMNILAAQAPALIWPFSQNREQRIRAERLARIGTIDILEDHDLQPYRLAAAIKKVISVHDRPWERIDLEGAAKTAKWLDKWTANQGRL